MKDFNRCNFLDKQMPEAAISNQRSSTSETNAERREFIKIAGLGAIALGAGFSAIDYLVQLLGIDHVSIASDYTNQISMSPAEQKAGWKMMIDSGAWTKEAYPYDVLAYPNRVSKGFSNLTDALLGRGYKKEDIAKLWGGNWLRVMREVVG